MTNRVAATGRISIVNGGFLVKSEGSNRCQITPYENYQLSYWMSPLCPLLRRYIFWAMKKELRDLSAMD
jgi:hypothetical protein